MTKTKTLQAVTFQQLSEALTRLRFQKHDTPEFTLFRNAELDAVIILPVGEASLSLNPIHLAAARATVVGKGVASPAEFDRLLLGAVPKDRLRERSDVESEAAALPEGRFVTLKPDREAEARAVPAIGAKIKAKKRAGAKRGHATH